MNHLTIPRQRNNIELDNILRTQSYVNGQWVDAASGKTFDVHNPATGELIASVTDMSREDVRNAIDAAHNAWPSYRDLTAGERASLLKKWYALILEHKKELATLMT
ncbi:MAG: aldehyde dehydrogenase family protein, partial [Bacteroidota bacterium]|nr:aldehyde dehydrogenase family protein [Bacteroidota bacterium]